MIAEYLGIVKYKFPVWASREEYKVKAAHKKTQFSSIGTRAKTQQNSNKNNFIVRIR